jgi:hypothetical protein
MAWEEVGFSSMYRGCFAKNVGFLPLCFCKCEVFVLVYEVFGGI